MLKHDIGALSSYKGLYVVILHYVGVFLGSCMLVDLWQDFEEGSGQVSTKLQPCSVSNL